ncbi:MAG TPA: sugar phosphate nucleotidyltransferase [Candidatus Binatia bacterium]|nr:sugar phosphate nucleotidyltransferase [Candidatus Binatia bacterium]
MARPGVWALVLAGGDGVRLQGLTRALTGAPIPKQYCRIVGDRSMLEATLARTAPLVPPARTLAVVNRDHLPLAREQLRVLPARNVLVQPSNRDTGPGILFGLFRLARRSPAATVVVLPTDHFVRDEGRFLAHLARAIDVVRRLPKRIVLLGIVAQRAETGLGWVQPGRALSDDATMPALRVRAFVEKPDAATAEAMMRAGGLWNSFVMCFRLDAMFALLARHRPHDVAALRRGGVRSHSALPPWNFSRDFLARVPRRLLVVPVGDVGWSDWGTPEAIERSLVALNVVPPWRRRRTRNEVAA